MATHPIVEGLPSNIAASVGRIISRWAYQEWLLYQIIYALLEIGPKQGRIAVRQPRPQEIIIMIADLLVVKGIYPTPLTLKKFNDLSDDLTEIRAKRDALAHSIWIKTPNGLAIQDTRGKWKGLPKNAPRVTKSMSPGYTLITPTYLKKLRAGIERSIKKTLAIQRELSELDELLASLHIPLGPDPLENPPA